MEGHLVWIGVAIVVVFVLQLSVFFSTLSKLRIFRRVFSNDDSNYSVIIDEDNVEITGIASEHKNSILSSIIQSINNYLVSNSHSTADFHLIKDMVERDCESAEDEIASQVPMPLYCGLMGTMFGILVGVGYLVGTGALSQLIGEANPGGGNAGVAGIQALLGGVALAMVTSIIGILFTTIGSYAAKNAKKQVETNKNTFLSWMQAKLLPELSSDTASALNRLTRNLNSFNQTFSQNTQELKKTLSVVNETTLGQAALLDAVQNLNISGLTTANIEVYEKLKNATNEVGKFGEYVHGINSYVANVQELAAKLGDANERTRMIEEMAEFFKKERANLNAMKALISKTIGEADDKLIQVAAEFKASSEKQFSALSVHAAKQQEKFKEVAKEQQETMVNAISAQKTVIETALSKRLEDIQKLTTELEQIKPLKEGMIKLEAAAQNQNREIDKLTRAILELVHIKSEIGASPSTVSPEPVNRSIWPMIVACAAVTLCSIAVIISIIV